MTTKITGILLVILISFPAGISCNKDNDDPDPDPPPPASNQVVMENLAYAPASLTVPAGTTVTWINRDNVVHTITSDTGVFNSGNVNTGGSFTYTFNNTGTYPYHCIHHAGMKGTVVVQ